MAVVTDAVMKALDDDKRFHRNMKREEYQAFQDLKKRNIIIKTADKGGAIVVMDKDIYIREARRQLSQTNIDEKQSANPTEAFIQEVRDLLKVLLGEEVITEEMRSYANPEGTVAARFYVHPKVHKRGVP